MGRMTGAEHGSYVDIIDRFRRTFAVAAKQRPQRRGFNPATGVPDWVGFELAQMLALVNAMRAERGDEPVPEDAVRRVEQGACGHVDYASKYAIGCAELVWFGSRGRPGT